MEAKTKTRPAELIEAIDTFLAAYDRADYIPRSTHANLEVELKSLRSFAQVAAQYGTEATRIWLGGGPPPGMGP